METLKFVHRISKGTRFNQIYIPHEMKEIFEVGDSVEVRLIEKRNTFYSSKKLELGEFKKKLSIEILNFLSQLNDVEQAFIVGSFLNSSDYGDVDILIISEKNLEGKVYSLLTERFGMKFHIIAIPKKRLEFLIKSCPLTRSMLYFFISNKKFELPKETVVDKGHIEFLLMMPKDLLEIKLASRVFYDNLRRLIAIGWFLENKEINPLEINKEIKREVKEGVFSSLKNNEELDEKAIEKLRGIIKAKIRKIEVLWERNELFKN
jgi:REP element-mobilizing transposase RayT